MAPSHERFDSGQFADRTRPIHRLRAVGRATESAAVRSGLTIRSRPIGELAGFEALVRWRHPTRGLLAPSAFIELAEESGAIDDLGWLVFDRAIEQLGRWRALGRVDATATMAVNVSVRQLQSAEFLDRIRRSLADRRLPAERITIEVTESVLADSASVRDRLQAMREMGLQIAIDDFGTGYSSLAYVRDFPVDILKIDRSFVSKLGRDSRDNAMVAMIVHLARDASLMGELRIGKISMCAAWATTALIAFSVVALGIVSVLPGI